MKDSVAHFCLIHCVTLSAIRADAFRPVEAGTYTHRNLPYGAMRCGITDGVHAIFVDSTVGSPIEVSLTNLDFEPDYVEARPSLNAKKPRVATHRPCTDPQIGEVVYDSDGVRISITTEKLRTICRGLLDMGETLSYKRPTAAKARQ